MYFFSFGASFKRIYISAFFSRQILLSSGQGSAMYNQKVFSKSVAISGHLIQAPFPPPKKNRKLSNLVVVYRG